MKRGVPEFVEEGRVVTGPMGSKPEWGMNGAFRLQGPKGNWFIVIVSDEGGWDHVSVECEVMEVPGYHTKPRMPTWEEMCWIKDLFWDKEETAVQYHPARSKYVNLHPYVLHLWRDQVHKMITPPIYFV